MKPAKRNLVVAVVFMLGTLFNYATNIETISKNTKYVKVVFENVVKGQSLVIKDDNGFTLHKEDVSKSGELVKFFNFSSLKDGHYNIELDKDFEILVKRFEVKSNQIIFKKDAESIIFKPVVQNKEDRILISRINFDKKPMDVTIYYNESVIVEETIASEEDLVNKIYKLNGLEKGDYRVVISNNHKNYIRDFSL